MTQWWEDDTEGEGLPEQEGRSEVGPETMQKAGVISTYKPNTGVVETGIFNIFIYFWTGAH